MRVESGAYQVTLHLDIVEATALYTLALAVNEPGAPWADAGSLLAGEDTGPLVAALMVQLSAVVGP